MTNLVAAAAALCVLAGGCLAQAPEAAATAQSETAAKNPAPDPCAKRKSGATVYIVCTFSRDADIRLFLNDETGAPYRHFSFVDAALAAHGERLVFAMNAGMYHEDRSPVGYYRENGEDLAPINTNDGPGNFHLKPNGVFFVSHTGAPAVEETGVFLRVKRPPPRFATQSGPMLVIDGDIHPRFLPDSTSRKRRNAVGVTENGDVAFVLADNPVRFYDMAVFMRDTLQTPNALYLDGVISRIYAPRLERNDPGLAMGPIVGVVETAQ